LTKPLPAHPWNRGFTWETPRGPFRRVTEEQVAHLDECAFVVLEEQLDPALVRRVTREVDVYEASAEAFLRTQTDERMMIAEAGRALCTWTTSRPGRAVAALTPVA